MAASSSTSKTMYDVFLSFRGKDTRDNFISHIYNALLKGKIETFMDNKLNRGDEISQSLIRAINQSRISLIIFSENYADSEWCLDELVKILQCRESSNQIVIPVFYKVDPSDVRHQTGTFGRAFDLLVKNNESKEQIWRGALKQVANLSGWDSSTIRSEAILVETVIGDVLQKLKMSSTNDRDTTKLVGSNSQIEKIMCLLSIGSPEFRMVGICGKSGSGKTTIAEAIYYKISCIFEDSYFLNNVKEKANRGGLDSMRNYLISKLLKHKSLPIPTPLILDPHIKDRLSSTRVLVVLDDVGDSLQLQYLMGGSGVVLFGPGSRVIVTTRNKQVFGAYDMAQVYDMERLHKNDARQLFSDNAFCQNQPPQPFLEFSKTVVGYAKDVLPLKVIGASLRRVPTLYTLEKIVQKVKKKS